VGAQFGVTRIGADRLDVARPAERQIDNLLMRPGRAVITAMRSPSRMASSIEW